MYKTVLSWLDIICILEQLLVEGSDQLHFSTILPRFQLMTGYYISVDLSPCAQKYVEGFI